MRQLEKDLKKSYSEKYSKMQSSRELSKERRLVQLEQMKTKMDERKIRRIKQEHCKRVRDQLASKKSCLLNSKSKNSEKFSSTEKEKDIHDSDAKSPLHTVLRNLDHLASLERAIKSDDNKSCLPRLYTCMDAKDHQIQSPSATQVLSTTKVKPTRKRVNSTRRRHSQPISRTKKSVHEAHLPNLSISSYTPSFITQSCQLRNPGKKRRRGSYLAPTKGSVSRRRYQVAQKLSGTAYNSIKPKSRNKYLNDLHRLKNDSEKRIGESVKESFIF